MGVSTSSSGAVILLSKHENKFVTCNSSGGIRTREEGLVSFGAAVDRYWTGASSNRN